MLVELGMMLRYYAAHFPGGEQQRWFFVREFDDTSMTTGDELRT